MAYTIYDKNGNERLAEIEVSLKPNAGRFVEPQLEYNGTWMGECFVTLNIKSPVPIDFAIGDYVMYRGEKFVINYDPSVIKKATKKSTGDAFSYNSVKFSALSYELSDMRMLDYVIGDNNIHYSGLPKFSFFCSNIEDLADRLQTNSDRYCYDNHISDAEKWLFITPSLSRTQQRAGVGIAYDRATEKYNLAFSNGSHTEDERINQNVNIDNMSVWDSMRYIKEAFGLSFVVRGRVVIIGAAWINTTGLFKYGKGNGLYEIERVADSEQQVVTKLYAYGSSKNMPDRYYADMSGSPLPNNLAVDVLMLPGFPKMSLYEWVTKPVAQGGGGGSVVDSTTGKASWRGYTAYFSKDAKTPWVMSLNSDSMGIREDTKYFDGSDGTDEIYPTIENTGADTIHSASVIEDNGVFEDGQEVADFNIYLPNLGFDLASLITSESAISIKDGYCGGRDFPIVSAQQVTLPEDGTDVTLWEVTCNRVKDESTKLWYPYSDGMAHGGMYSADEPYQIRTGDKYVLVGIQMPDTYISSSSERLLEASLDFLSKNDATRYTYIPKVDEIYMARQAQSVEGTDNPAYHDIITEGDVMLFEDDDLNIDGSVYIDTLRIKEYGNQHIPTYEVTLRNDKQVGTLQRIQNQIATLTSTGGGGGSTGNINVPQVEQLIRVYGSDLFLSKRQDDTANGKIRFNNNVQFGHDFVGGITGVGGRIDKDANAELESLSLRRFLEVPELRYNRISIQVGNRWRAPGGGIILRVVPDEDSSGNILNTGTIYLHLEDGEIGKVAVDDICMGIYHDGMNTNDNDSDDFDDSRGNFRFSGFFTTYFTVTRIVEESDNSVFEYALRDDENYPASHHPCDMMHFVCYGNFTNPDRQSSRYSTLTYERYLYHVNTWEFSANNVAAQFGDLSNLSVYGLDMTGYSAYLNNIYMTGRLEQIRQLADEMSSYSVDFSDYVDVITIDDVGNVIGGLYKVENNTPYDYRIHSTITVRKNHQVLTICGANEPVTTGKYKIYAEPVRCTYTLANSTIYITSIENIKDGIPGTPDDVNFDYDAMREMTNCFVNLTIDCEGVTTLVKQFPITIKHMSEPFVDADISNESSGVSWNTKTQAYVGLPIVFDLTMYHNNEVLDITSTSNVSLTTSTSGVTLVQGTAPTPINATSIYYSKTIETITKFAGTPNEVTYKVARITITAMGKDVPLVTNIDVTGTAIYAGVPYERTLTHTINKSTDTNVYSLLPSVDEVVVSKNGSLSDNSLTCSVICDSSDDKHYTVSSSDFSKHNLALRYKRFYTDGTSDSSYQTYNGSVTVNSDMRKVAFYLFGTVNGSVSTSIVHDTEEVPVIANGVDGAGVEYVFWVQESWNGDSSSGMNTPMIRDDSSLPAFQVDSYEPYGRNSTTESWTNTWKDEPIGVSGNVGYKYEFYAQRKKVNGIWQAFGDVHLWNKYTQSGSSPYVLDLSNDNSLINCDEDGTIIGTYETSEIMIFEGGRDAYDDFTVTITGVNITATLSNRVITVSNMTAVGAQVNVQAVNNSDSSIVLTAVYSIRKVFPGDSTVIYSLQPSLQVIHKHGDNGGFIDTTMSVQVKKSVGIDTTILTTPTEMATEGLKLCYVQGTGSTEHTFTNDMAAIATSTLCGNAAYTTIYLRDLETGQKMYDRERICTVSDGDTGSTGPMGLTGCHERVFQVYTPGMTYRNDEDATNITGIRYVDFMCIRNDALESGYSVYMCNETHEAAASWSQDWNSGKWTPVSINASSAYFNYLIAKNAHFEFGSSNQLVIYDSSNNIVGGLTGEIPDEYNEDDSVRIWAGGSNPSTAPFRVQQDGQMFADKAHVQGLVEIKNASDGVMVYDSSDNLRVQIVAGEVAEPVNETTYATGTAQQTTKGSQTNRIDLTPMPIRLNMGELKAGAVISASSTPISPSTETMLYITVSSGNNTMRITGSGLPEKIRYELRFVTSNGNVIYTTTGGATASGSGTTLSLPLLFYGPVIPVTATYYAHVYVWIEDVNEDNTASDTFGGIASTATITTTAKMCFNQTTPQGTRIGTNGLFVNMGTNKSFSVTEDDTEIRYGDYRIKVDNNGIYRYSSTYGYIPMIKKVKTISSDYTILAEDGVLFLNNSSTINLTLTSGSSDEIKIISKSGVEYNLLGMPVVRSNGQAASPFTADDYRPRIFVKDTSVATPSWYELYCSN